MAYDRKLTTTVRPREPKRPVGMSVEDFDRARAAMVVHGFLTKNSLFLVARAWFRVRRLNKNTGGPRVVRPAA